MNATTGFGIPLRVGHRREGDPPLLVHRAGDRTAPRSGAAARHLVGTAGLDRGARPASPDAGPAALGRSPVLPAVLPAARRNPLLPRGRRGPSAPRSPSSGSNWESRLGAFDRRTRRSPDARPFTRVLGALASRRARAWTAGTLLVGAPARVRMLRVRRIRREAAPIRDAGVDRRDAAPVARSSSSAAPSSCSRAQGSRRHDVGTAAGRFSCSAAQARLWEVERRRVVLLHELAHVRARRLARAPARRGGARPLLVASRSPGCSSGRCAATASAPATISSWRPARSRPSTRDTCSASSALSPPRRIPSRRPSRRRARRTSRSACAPSSIPAGRAAICRAGARCLSRRGPVRRGGRGSRSSSPGRRSAPARPSGARAQRHDGLALRPHARREAAPRPAKAGKKAVTAGRYWRTPRGLRGRRLAPPRAAARVRPHPAGDLEGDRRRARTRGRVRPGLQRAAGARASGRRRLVQPRNGPPPPRALRRGDRGVPEGDRRGLPRRRRVSYNIACGYALKGDKDKAFEWLHRADGRSASTSPRTSATTTTSTA